VSVPTIVPPATRDQIVDAFERLHADSNEYWNGFTTPVFFQKLGTAWSPADNVRHLIKSTRPVAKAMTVPKILLRFKFGKPKRTSISFGELAASYEEAVPRANAGPFSPSERSEADLEKWRNEIMSERAAVHARLIEAISGWKDAALDRYQLPHPILGNLTMREMLFFTLHHQVHHIGVVERRRGGG
jgi:hypothetical protein